MARLSVLATAAVATAAFAVQSTLTSVRGSGSSAPSPITITTASSLFPMPPHMVGHGWEMWVFLGSYLPHLSDPTYRAIAKGMTGQTVRLGGITADWVRYAIDSTPAPNADAATVSAAAEARSAFVTARAARINSQLEPLMARSSSEHRHRLQGYWPNAPENITSTDFLELLDFLGSAGIRLLFDLNELYGRDCNTTKPGTNQPDWCVGTWDTSNVRTFLQWVHDSNLYIPPAADGSGGGTLVGFELGNELVTHLDPAVNTQDILTLVGLVREVWSDVPASAVPPVFAPSTDDCNDDGQHQIMTNVTGSASVYTYHAYPGQSGTGADNLTQILLNSTWLREGIMSGSNSKQCIGWWNEGPRAGGLGLWVTEASSSWAWDLPPPAQNSVIHGFFKVPELGQYAATGVGMVGRWSFSEQSPFGLIVQNGTRWDVAADYWVLSVFNATRDADPASSGVLAVSGDEATPVLAYAHCAPQAPGAVTIMAVNPSSQSVQLSPQTPAGVPIATLPRLEWVLTAPAGNLSSTTPVLNGNEAAPLRVNADGTQPPMPPVPVGSGGDPALTLPPQSQAFFVLLSAQAPACPGAAAAIGRSKPSSA